MDSFHQLSVTHRALEEAFLKLGFTLPLYETHRLYVHEESGSIHMLSSDTMVEQRVRPAHLSAARHSAVAMGVTDEETFRKLLLDETVEKIPRGVRATRPLIPTLS